MVPVADIWSREKRSEVMSKIRGRDTRPERQLRRALWAVGCRYRLHLASVPGRPDVCFPGERLAVFVHGCFWHGCPIHYTPPKAHPAFWRRKIGKNRARDRRTLLALGKSGWSVIEFWEHDLERDGGKCAQHVVTTLRKLRRRRHGDQ